MKDKSSIVAAMRRGTIRNAGWGVWALTGLWLALGAISAAALEFFTEHLMKQKGRL
jgi:hypothetical protein